MIIGYQVSIKLGDFIVINLEKEALNQKVKKYALENGSWDWNKLNGMLPNDFLDILVTIKAPERGVRQDRVAWLPTIDSILPSNQVTSV